MSAIVMLLAGLGFAVSLIAHLLALAGMRVPGDKAVFVLHAGIFVVWLPTVFILRRATRGVVRRDLWKVALSGCPRWMKWAVWITFGYAILNFVLFAATTSSHEPPRAYAVEPSVVRGFSGHWLVFYGMAFAVMYSVRAKPWLLRERRCTAQHVVSPMAEYCEKCGERLATVERR